MAVGDPAVGSGDLFVDFREVVFFAAFRAVELAARFRALALVTLLADLRFVAVIVFAVVRLRAFGLVADLRERALAAAFLGFAIAGLLP